MTGTELALLLTIVVMLLILMVLAAAETALNRISRVKAQAIADGNDSPHQARAVVKLVAHPERFINPLLVTITVLQSGQTWLVARLADSLVSGVAAAVGIFALNVVVFFIVAEAMPKTWAVLHTERAGLATARFTNVLVSFPPLRLISRALIWLTNVLLPGKGLKQGPFVSESELLGIVGAAAADDVIEHDERELIESIIEFGDTVREVMVPRPDMAIIPHSANVSAALDIAIDQGFSRLPVAGEKEDDVVGIAYTKDLMRAERTGKGDMAVSELVRDVRFVPENKPLRQLMREMQAGKFHLALVADEYGAISGLITLEDCLEELVGEIVDEYDNETPDVVRLPSGEYLVDGGMSVSELNDLLDIRIPDDDWDTIGGFVFNTLGHVPARGDSIEHGGWQFIADLVEGRRIRRLRVIVTAFDRDDDDDHDGEADGNGRGHSGK